MVRGVVGAGEIDWAKYLYDDGIGDSKPGEIAVIPKNIVSERRKRLEGLLSKRKTSEEDEEVQEYQEALGKVDLVRRVLTRTLLDFVLKRNRK